jgi:hypothetical protein
MEPKMDLSRNLALRLLKRQDWGRTPAQPRTRRTVLGAARQRATRAYKDPSQSTR